MFRDDPALMIDAGMLKVVSAHRFDEDGNAIGKMDRGEAKRATLVQPMTPNRPQRRILDVREMHRFSGRRFNPRIVKARSIGATTIANAIIVPSVCTNPGVRAIEVAHNPRSAETIYRIGREMIKCLPDWIRPQLDRDSKELVAIENPEWGVTMSRIECVSVTNVDALRGDRALFLLKDECAYYENIDQIDNAVNSVVMDNIQASEWDISTGNGEDEYFFERFMSSWEAQGGSRTTSANPWEKGCRHFRDVGCAMFFPWYFDTSKMAALHLEITEEWLLSQLDETERFLLEEHLLPQWHAEGYADSAARSFAAKQLYWRRCKIITLYRGMPRVDVGTQLRTLKQFQREEPSTVEDAFISTKGDFVFPLQVLSEIEKKHKRQPVFVGAVSESGVYSTGLTNGEEPVWMWKLPEEIVGRTLLCVDPCSGIPDGQGSRWDWKRDFTYGMLLEEGADGVWEQVGEYISQSPGRMTGPDLLRLCEFVSSGRGEDYYPNLGIEYQFGADILNFFIKSEAFPTHKIYRLRKDERAGRQAASIWGFHSSAQRKANAVRYLAEMFLEERLVIRSRRAYQQFGNFVEVADNKFQARAKGGGGVSSKDDAVMSSAIAAYIIEHGGVKGSEFGSIDPTGEGRPLFKPPDSASTNEHIRFLMQCFDKGVDPNSVPDRAVLETGTRPGKRLLLKKD